MIDPVAIQIGPFAIHWYALCIMTGSFWQSIFQVKKRHEKK